MKRSHFHMFLLLINAVFAFSGLRPTLAADELIHFDLNLSGSSSPAALTAADGVVYFAAYLPSYTGGRLWVSDGTASGTKIVSDFPRLGLLDNSQTHYSNGQLLFAGFAENRGEELFRSDGTSQGTYLVKDINFRSIPPFTFRNASSSPDAFTQVGNVIYFRASTGDVGLWRTDGTEAGTVLVKEISATWLTGNQFFLLFSGDDGFDTELWESVGSGPGTVMVKDINPSGRSNPENLITIGDTTYFTADDGSNGRELWKTNGTAAGTLMVADLNPDGSTAFGEFSANNGILYFTINEGDQLWRSDGTTAGTYMLKEPRGVGNSEIGDFAVLNGVLYFRAMNGVSWDLWKTDGTTEGTVQVTHPAQGGIGLYPRDMMTCNGRLFFLGSIPFWGVELHESDGTEAGTRGVQDIRIAEEDSNIQHLTCVENKLFFSADNGIDGQELWVYIMDDCIPVDAHFDFRVPCFKVGGAFYEVTFRSVGGNVWEADLTTLSETVGGGRCVEFDSSYRFTIPCLNLERFRFQMAFKYTGTGLRWRPDPLSIVFLE